MDRQGLFRDQRVELVEGLIYNFKKPQSSQHATGIRIAYLVLDKVFGAGFDVRSQLPLHLGPQSMPEPDLSVVPGEPDDYFDHHPTQALLVVEVSDASDLHDRRRKARLYARWNIQDYWIVLLRLDGLEVLREPVDGLYRTRRIFRRGETISPLARPEAALAVDDLLPGNAPTS